MGITRYNGTFSVVGNIRPKKSDAMTLGEAVERLNAKKRGKGKLKPAATRDAIDTSIAQAVPTLITPTTGGGIASPLTEVADTRVTAVVRICDPMDATRWIDIEAATQITFEDANGDEVIMNLLPDTTGNCP